MPVPASEPAATALVPTDRATLRRKKDRGNYDRDVVDAILDEGLVCHVGFAVDDSIFVMPMAYARLGDTIYLHGATGNRMLRHLATGPEVCVTVTLLDALVLARSAFHHSMNYRSVMLFGRAVPVRDDEEKLRAHRSPCSNTSCRDEAFTPVPLLPTSFALPRSSGSRSQRDRPRSAPAVRSTNPKTWGRRSGPGTSR